MERPIGFQPANENGVAYAYDANFKGPTKTRMKTDSQFAVVFGVVMFGWLLLGLWATISNNSQPDNKISSFSNNQFYSEYQENGMFRRYGRSTWEDKPSSADLFKRQLSTIAIGLLFVMIAAMLLIYLMRWIATPLLWTFIVLVHLALLILAIAFFQNKLNSFGLLAALAFTILLLVIIAMRRRIKLALTLINEGSRAVCTMWTTIFFPIIPAVLKVFVYLFTIHVYTQVALMGGESILLYGYNTIAAIWAHCFITAFAEITLAGTFGTYYWSHDKKQVPKHALTTSIVTSIKFHVGTIALGSGIIAMCRVLRKILGVDNNRNGRACFRWCLAGSFERMLRQLNRNAYIMCAIHGKGLCASATDAFFLIARNVLRFIALGLITNIVFGLSKLLLAIGTAAITYAVLNNGTPSNADGPIIFSLAISAFLIADVFLSVYGIACDTLLLCFLEDCERNDGSVERPYFMSKRLMTILSADNEDGANGADGEYHRLRAEAHYNDY